jgi:hypothetical protein
MLKRCPQRPQSKQSSLKCSLCSTHALDQKLQSWKSLKEELAELLIFTLRGGQGTEYRT